jgi:predicted dehydrogenase
VAPVRLGVAGVGWWGGELLRGAQIAGLRPTACYSPTGANRTRFAEAHGLRAVESWEALIGDDEIDAVAIATPHSTHGRLVVDAAAAGKHIFVEKPFTLTVDEGLEAIAAAEEAGVALQVGHNRRRQAPTRRIRQMIESGALGTPVLADVNMSGPSGSAADNWRADPSERPMSGMTQFGVHMIDALHYLLGPVERVTAVRGNVLESTPLDDAAALILEFTSGALGQLATSAAVPTTTRLGVLGSEATAWNIDDGARLAVQRTGEKELSDLPFEAVDTVADQMADFALAVTGDGAPEVGGRQGLAVVAVLEAAMESAASGRPVAVRKDGLT